MGGMERFGGSCETKCGREQMKDNKGGDRLGR